MSIKLLTEHVNTIRWANYLHWHFPMFETYHKMHVIANKTREHECRCESNPAGSLSHEFVLTVLSNEGDGFVAVYK